MNEHNMKKFIDWLKVNDPFLYELSMRRALYKNMKRQSLSGFLDSITGAFSSIVDTVSNIGPKYYEMKLQKEMLEQQIKAVKAGSSPSTNIPYTPVVPPAQVPTTQVQQEIDRVAKETSGSKLSVVPIAIGAFFLSKLF